MLVLPPRSVLPSIPPDSTTHPLHGYRSQVIPRAGPRPLPLHFSGRTLLLPGLSRTPVSPCRPCHSSPDSHLRPLRRDARPSPSPSFLRGSLFFGVPFFGVPFPFLSSESHSLPTRGLVGQGRADETSRKSRTGRESLAISTGSELRPGQE